MSKIQVLCMVAVTLVVTVMGKMIYDMASFEIDHISFGCLDEKPVEMCKELLRRQIMTPKTT